jgi:hypothetical protein
MHVYEVRPRSDKRGVDLLSDALPFGRLWYDGPNAVTNAIGYAMQYSRFHFHKRSQLFISTHNEPLSVVPMRINNPDCLAVGIKG